MEDKEQKIKLTFDTNAETVNKSVSQLTDEIQEQKDLTIEFQKELLNLEKRLKETPKNSLAAQTELKRKIEELKGSIKDQSVAVKDLTNEKNKTAAADKEVAKSTKDVNKSITELDNPISNAISGFKAMIVQAWALVANPVGAVLAVIVGSVTLLGKAFLSTEDGGNKLSKGLSVISGLFSGLLKVLEPVASFLVDKLVKGFEMAGDAVLKTSNLIQKGLRALGFDETADKLNKLTGAVQNNVKASGQLADAEARLVAAQRLSQKVQLDYQKQAEKLRQLRDDESTSIEERIKINAQLGTLLQKQLNEELRIAKQALAVADLRIKLEGKSSANLDERAEALTTISDIQERLSGQESEQLANLNSLRRERAALIKAERDEALKYEKERLEEVKKFNDLNAQLEDERKEQKIKSDADLFERQNKQISDHVAQQQEIYKYDAEEQKRIDDATLKQKEEIEATKVSLAEKSVQLLSGIFGKSKKVQKAAMIAEGAISIGKQVAANNAANIGALATPQAIATSGAAAAPVIALNNISTGIGIASTIASTAKALQSLGGGTVDGGNSGRTSTGGGRPSSADPQVSFQASSENQIATTVSANNRDLPPIKAFVVGKDVSTQQSLDNNKINSNSL